MKRLLLTFFCLLLSACSGGDALSPKQQLKNMLSEVELATEERSLSQIMQHVSDEYLDHKGNTKKDITKYVQLQLIRNQNINMFTAVRSLEIDNDLATVELSVAMAARGVELNEAVARLRADSHQFSLVIKLEEQDWRIISASWRQGW